MVAAMVNEGFCPSLGRFELKALLQLCHLTFATWQNSSVQISNGLSMGTHAIQTPSLECLWKANRKEMGNLGKGNPFPNHSPVNTVPAASSGRER